MKKIRNFYKVSFLLTLFYVCNQKLIAQSLHPLVPSNYVFDIDSIKGFDEDLAKQMALNTGHFGAEFKVYLYFLKREYIQAKYNLQSAGTNFKGNNPPPNPLTAPCINEDFEDYNLTLPVPSTTIITTAGGIPGWTSSSGTNSGSLGSCNLSGCCPSSPQAIRVISPPSGGLIDALIGPSYPIYSVFGTGVNAGNGGPGHVSGVDSMRGNWFCKINEQTGNANINKISKTISVNSNNALFQFAFISVIEGAHCCCDNAGFSLKVKDCSNNVLACPQFTASPPAASYCTGGVTPCTYPSGTSIYQTTPMNPGWKYNPWKLTTLDLTPYIGSCVTIDVVGIDCTAGGHGGYVYFDAQCKPMCIIGNGNCFPAGTPQITLPTCGTGNTATVTAPSGTGPYQWTGPAGFIPSTSQTIITGITGNYTLTMTPPGACNPIVRTVSVVISPAPNVIVSNQTQFSCASPTTNAASISMGSGTPNATITPNYSVTWVPTPTTVVGSTSSTYSVSSLAVGINTVTITDAVGCTATTTLNVTPAPAVPAFSIAAPQGTVVGCVPPTISLTAVNTNTSLTSMTYTWTSTTTGVTNGATISGAAPGGLNTYTVSGSDISVGSCVATQTIQISQNTTPPGVTVTPTSGILTCNGAPVCFTATSTSTTNIVGQWYDPSSAPIGSISGTPILYCANQPGTYSVSFTDITNGCVSSQTVSVTANTIVPTMTVNALDGYTINCNKPCLKFTISGSSNIVPQTYTWENMQTAVTVTPPAGGYTICVPGNYKAGYKDGNGCQIYQQITVSIDTIRPVPSATTNLSAGSFTLNCYDPSLVATAFSNPMLPVSSYSWVQPSPSLVVASQTITVNTVSVTANPTTFTVMAQNPVNGCIGKQKVLFYEDLATPNYKIVFTPTAITCANQNVAVSVVPAVSTQTAPTTFTIMSPPPTVTSTTSGALFSTPGIYNAVVMLLSNGCTTNTPVNSLATNDNPPVVATTPSVSLGCKKTVEISSGVIPAPGYSYAWTGPGGISCTTCSVTGVDLEGEYDVVITNTVNGCIATNHALVGTSTVIPVSFTADNDLGFAPLAVNFTNNSLPFASTSTVTTTWGYGNGIAATTAQVATSTINPVQPPNGQTLYNTSGVYTVNLTVTQQLPAPNPKTCVGTASMVITVDLASQLAVPNVFTPNGDKVNDTFFLNTTNLTEVSCLIYDRWGVKMYDVVSQTGNISWDGKNLGGKEVPTGTYFYVITATGKDNETYEKKGTVSLYR